jgi:hypothetical protein
MPDPKTPETETHTETGAPKDEAHREAGDGTLQGAQPAGTAHDPDQSDANPSVDAGTG